MDRKFFFLEQNVLINFKLLRNQTFLPNGRLLCRTSRKGSPKNWQQCFPPVWFSGWVCCWCRWPRVRWVRGPGAGPVSWDCTYGSRCVATRAPATPSPVRSRRGGIPGRENRGSHFAHYSESFTRFVMVFQPSFSIYFLINFLFLSILRWEKDKILPGKYLHLTYRLPFDCFSLPIGFVVVMWRGVM